MTREELLDKAIYIQYPLNYSTYKQYDVGKEIHKLPLPERGMMYDNWKYNDNHEIQYNSLQMFNANSWDDRNKKGISPEFYKASYYKQHDEYKLFIESDDKQAKKIAEISQKPCFCVETNKLYDKKK